MSAHETLGLLLVREGLITRPQLYDALRLQRQTGRLLGTCLLSLGYLRPEALLSMLARQLAIPALPPGTLNRASPDAVRRVPREVAMRLRILPYSWDGQMLGVALADGRVLGQLHEVAYHARAAVGAYVALETEIETVLRTVYPQAEEGARAAISSADATIRPRPPTTERDLGSTSAAPATPTSLRRPLATPQVTAAATDAESAKPSADAPSVTRVDPAILANQALERVGFFDAVEQVYEARSPAEIGRMMGQALLNYFQRVFIALCDGEMCRVVGYAGIDARRTEVPEIALPLTIAKLNDRQLAYGLAAMDVRNAELGGLFGFDPGMVSLVASVGARPRPRLVVLADNYATSDLYDDLHDIELLFKEAETGLEMLLERS